MTHIDEYYVIRLTRLAHHAKSSTDGTRDVFISDSEGAGGFHKARRYPSIDAAEAYLAEHTPDPRYQYHIQFCTTESRDKNHDDYSVLTQRLMEIPYPYRRTAYNWLRGKDVEALLRSESDEVYDRHRRMLLDYDFDISVPSTVVMLQGKRRLHIDLPAYATDTGPRQYFAHPSQRPRPVAAEDEDEGSRSE